MRKLFLLFAITFLCLFSNASILDSYNLGKTIIHHPENKARASQLNLHCFDKNNNLYVATNGANCGVSVFDGTNWHYWNKENGLISDVVTYLYCDRKGSIWVGADSGVSVYNGSGFKKYYFEEYTYSIENIIEDKNDNFLFFAGYYVYQLISDKLKRIDVPFFSQVRSSVFTKDSLILAATYDGIWEYNGVNWKRHTVSNGLVQNDVEKLKIINDTIYCYYSPTELARKSLSKFNGTRWEKVSIPADLEFYISCIAEDVNHRLLIYDGTYIFLRKPMGWVKFSTYQYHNSSISIITNDNNFNQYWFGYNGEFGIFNGQFNKISNNLNKRIGVSLPNYLFIDKSNNLWVKNSVSIERSFYDGKNWTYFPADSLRSFFGNYDAANFFTQDTSGKVYSSGYIVFKYDGTKFEGFDTKYNTSYFRNIFFDSKNHFWFIDGYGIVNMFDGENTISFDELSQKYGTKKFIEDNLGNIWLIGGYTYNKLYKYDGTKWDTIDAPFLNCEDVEVDKKGNLWFACGTEGLFRYNAIEGFKNYDIFNSDLLENGIYNIVISKDDVLILTYSWSKNTNISLMKDEIFKHIKLDYSHIVVTDLAIDKYNKLYIASNNYDLIEAELYSEQPTVTANDISCTGAEDGKITIHSTSIDCSYSIDGGVTFQTDSVFNNLKAGEYSIVVKLGASISTPIPVTIKQPEGTFIVEKTNTSCLGVNDGSIKIITSGLDSIRFQWTNGIDTSFIDSLSKGIYSVKVTYKNCEFNRDFTIDEPALLHFTSSIYNDCGSHKGKIEIEVSGGTSPYKINWSTGDTTNVITNLDSGDYILTIEDAVNCMSLDTSISIKKYDEIPQSQIFGATKKYLCSNTIELSTINDFSNYQWRKNNTFLNNNSKSLIVEEPSKYYVSVIDSNSCFAIDSIEVVRKTILNEPRICVVTVDELTNKNKIQWNKLSTTDSLIQMILFKESNVKDIYEYIGIMTANTPGLFIDDSSNPDVKSDRYKLAIIDECSVQINSTNVHKTIHLTSNVGSRGEMNLIWSGYEGFDVSSYNIYRSSESTRMELLGTIQSNLNSYTDVNPPSGKNVYYQIEALSSSNCLQGQRKAALLGSSRSNIIRHQFTSINKTRNEYSIKIGPNPVTEKIEVSIGHLGESMNLSIFDVNGKLIYKQPIVSNNTIIDRENIQSGTYFVRIAGENIQYYDKIIFK